MGFLHDMLRRLPWPLLVLGGMLIVYAMLLKV